MAVNKKPNLMLLLCVTQCCTFEKEALSTREYNDIFWVYRGCNKSEIVREKLAHNVYKVEKQQHHAVVDLYLTTALADDSQSHNIQGWHKINYSL